MSQTYPAYRGLRFEEEVALERMLSGITVPNAQGKSLPVGVTWRMPLRELQQVRYPYFLLEFLDLSPRRNEEHRGVVPFYYESYTGNPLATGTHNMGEYPVPVLLYYQCSVYSNNQQHDVILNDLCATTFFPIRYGQLNCPSGTSRRLDFESMVNRDSEDNNGRRIFCKVWTFSISAEILPSPYGSYPPPTAVDIKVEDISTGYTDPTVVVK